MKESKLTKLLKQDNAELAMSDNITVSLCFASCFTGLRWCVVQTHPCKIPKWQFWRVRFTECSMYGPFPSRNQAVKFANYLAKPV